MSNELIVLVSTGILVSIFWGLIGGLLLAFIFHIIALVK